ncbi:complement C1q-like protein 4 [Glandiceps talaboti]
MMYQYITIACLAFACFGDSAHAKMVGFSVARETAFGPLAEADRLQFEVALTNTDDCFDLATGVFTAPVSGHYFFNVNAHKANDLKDSPALRIAVNMALRVSAAESGNDGMDSASNSLIFHMKAGELAWVHCDAGGVVSATHGRETSFHGFLISED